MSEESLDGRRFAFAGRASGWWVASSACFVAVLLVFSAASFGLATVEPPPDRAAPEAPRYELVPPLARAECEPVSGIPADCPYRPWPLNQMLEPEAVAERFEQVLQPRLEDPGPLEPHAPGEEALAPGCSEVGDALLCLNLEGVEVSMPGEQGFRALGAQEVVGGLSGQEWEALWWIWLLSDEEGANQDKIGHWVRWKVTHGLAARRRAELPMPTAEQAARLVEQYPDWHARRWQQGRIEAVEAARDIQIRNQAAKDAYFRARLDHERELDGRVEAFAAYATALERWHALRSVGSVTLLGGSLLALLMALWRRRRLEGRIGHGHLEIDGHRWAWRDIADLRAEGARLVVSLRDGTTVRTRPVHLDDDEAERLQDEVRSLLVSDEDADEEREKLRRAQAQRAHFERG